MINFHLFKKDFTALKEHIARRNMNFDFDNFTYVYQKLTQKQKTLEELQNERNQISNQIASLKAQKDTANQSEIDQLIEQVKKINVQITLNQNQVNWLLENFEAYLAIIPNLLSADVPLGKDEKDNKIIKTWKNPTKFNYPILNHYDIGQKLKIFDSQRAAKIAKSRFTCISGKGAMLERAIAQFMIDWQIKQNGYTEISVPFLVNQRSMFSTGQLPKFKHELYGTSDDLFLIPTAEVPLTALFQNEIIDEAELPLKFVSLTPCFRKEAGSYGKDTKGLIRLHQFLKVELVWITSDDETVSKAAHAQLLKDAESVLEQLELPYQVLLLSSGDTGFCAAKCFDIEVFLPGEKKYREISSCSNCTDFQTRRANIKFRPANGDRPRLAHSLNGSGLAVGRTMAAILENYQNKDQSITIPNVLKKYLGDDFRL